MQTNIYILKLQNNKYYVGKSNDLETCILKAGIYSVKVSKEMSNLTTHLSSWNDLEVESSDTRKNECPNLYGDKLKPFLLGMVAGCNAWSQQLKYQPKMLATVLLAGVQFQLVQVEGFITFLNLRQQTDKNLELAIKDKQAAIESKKQGKPIQSSSSSMSMMGMTSIFGAAKTEKEIMLEKEKLVTDLQEQLNFMTRGLIFSEIDRFSYERVENIKQLCKDVIAVNLDLAQRSQFKWQEVASTVGIVLSDFEEKSKISSNSFNFSAFFLSSVAALDAFVELKKSLALTFLVPLLAGGFGIVLLIGSFIDSACICAITYL